jgi:hypothetical protein
MVPDFSGEPHLLTTFIGATDAVIAQYFNPHDPNNFQNTRLMYSLRNKLHGTAAAIINNDPTANWENTKNTLIQNFGDPRNEDCLLRDLTQLHQYPQESYQRFYDRCIHTQSLLNTQLDLCEFNQQRLQIKREFYNAQTLQTFLAGLKDPMGQLLRCQQPQSMGEAIQKIKREEGIQRIQRNLPRFGKPQYPQRSPNSFNNPRNFINHPNTTYAGPQTSRAQPRHNYRPNSNVWATRNTRPTYKPTPMSTNTRNTLINNEFHHPPPSRNFSAEELFAQGEVEENFPPVASTSRIIT